MQEGPRGRMRPNRKNSSAGRTPRECGLFFARIISIMLETFGILNIWAYALGVCLYTAGYVAAGDGLQLPVMGLLTMGAAIAAGVTGELFRRSETNRSNQSGSLGGLLFISISGAFLAAWIFRAAAAGETVSQFILTLAAAVILFFGTGIVLRYNERRNRV